MNKTSLPAGVSLFVVIVVLLVGFLALAIVDETYRPAFADLAKVGIGGYLAMLIPGSR